MSEQNDVRTSASQAGFIAGFIVASLIWWLVT